MELHRSGKQRLPNLSAFSLGLDWRAFWRFRFSLPGKTTGCETVPPAGPAQCMMRASEHRDGLYSPVSRFKLRSFEQNRDLKAISVPYL